MTDSLGIWKKLERTDPDHVKAFQRPGGFRGHAIKPLYAIRKMTETFGPCGIGWGYRDPDFRVVESGEEVAVYCTVTMWYTQDEAVGQVVGVGGDMVRKRTRNGFVADDEAFKKAFTDALTNAMKHLGMSADVHMGMFDDSKYVAELRREQQHIEEPLVDEDKKSPAAAFVPDDDGYPIFDVNGKKLETSYDPYWWFRAAQDYVRDLETENGCRQFAQHNRAVKQKIMKEKQDDNDLLDMAAELGDLLNRFSSKGRAA